MTAAVALHAHDKSAGLPICTTEGRPKGAAQGCAACTRIPAGRSADSPRTRSVRTGAARSRDAAIHPAGSQDAARRSDRAPAALVDGARSGGSSRAGSGREAFPPDHATWRSRSIAAADRLEHGWHALRRSEGATWMAWRRCARSAARGPKPSSVTAKWKCWPAPKTTWASRPGSPDIAVLPHSWPSNCWWRMGRSGRLRPPTRLLPTPTPIRPSDRPATAAKGLTAAGGPCSRRPVRIPGLCLSNRWERDHA